MLYIAARAPRAGQVKTRLARTIGDAAAARLYAAFLRDLGARFAAAPFPVGWYVTPEDAWPEIAPLAGARPAAVRVQPPGDWGERQRRLLALGGPTVLIASDSPHLGVDVVAAAFEALRDHDLVLGPTHDGGYALIGSRGGHDVGHHVLAGVEMSRADVVARVRARAFALDLRTAMLPATFDVDEAGDLRLLEREVERRDDMVATAAALDELGVAGRG